MVATEDVPSGQIICECPLYAACCLEETKKKMCATCLAVSDGRLDLKCAACGKAFFCSEECHAAASHLELPAKSANTVPHGYLCDALQQLGRGGKLDKQLVSILRLMLEIIVWRHLEGKGENRSVSHGDCSAFDLLEEHPEAWTPEECKEWEKPFRLLRTAIAACPLKIEEPTELELRQMCGRIEANVFGVIDDENRVVAQGIYLPAAMFNHSCTANCIVEEGTADVLRIRTATPVAAGSTCREPWPVIANSGSGR